MTIKGHGIIRRNSRGTTRHEIRRKLLLYVGITVLVMFVFYVRFKSGEGSIIAARVLTIQVNTNEEDLLRLRERAWVSSRLELALKMRALGKDNNELNVVANEYEISEKSESGIEDYAYYEKLLEDDESLKNMSTIDYSQTTPKMEYNKTNTLIPNVQSVENITLPADLTENSENVVEDIVSRLSVLALYTRNLADKYTNITRAEATDRGNSSFKRILQLDKEIQTYAKEAENVFANSNIPQQRKEEVLIELSRKSDVVLEILHGISDIKDTLGDTDYVEEND